MVSPFFLLFFRQDTRAIENCYKLKLKRLFDKRLEDMERVHKEKVVFLFFIFFLFFFDKRLEDISTGYLV